MIPDGTARMQRIVVMGPPGSGKSTVARRLGAYWGLPVFHLDQSYYRPGWIEAPPDLFAADVERIAALPAWVIDGNFIHTIEARFRAADTVIYLDIPAWLAFFRVVLRTIRNYGRMRPDGPPGCLERLDPGFLHFVYTYNRESRARNLALVENFAGRTIVLSGAGAVRRFLARSACRL